MTENASTATALLPSGTHTCSGCRERWSGVSRCHCAGTLTAQVEFLAVDAKKAKLMATKFKNLTPLPQGAGHLLAELVHDPLAKGIRRPRFTGPDPRLNQQAAVTTGGFTRVSWGTLAGESFAATDLLLDGPISNPLSKIVALQIKDTIHYLRSALPRTRGEQPATTTPDVITVRVSAGCHRTFTGEGAFSLHHVGGEGCLDPATLVRKEGIHAGERLLFLNNGLWGSEEHPAEPGAGLRAARERKAAEVNSQELVDA